MVTPNGDPTETPKWRPHRRPQWGRVPHNKEQRAEPWSYVWGGHMCGVDICVGWSYMWGGHMCGVVICVGWTYVWGGHMWGVVVCVGWSYVGGGHVCRVGVRVCPIKVGRERG